MREESVKKGLRVVTNNGRWGTVLDRACACNATAKEHNEDEELCRHWDGWWNVQEDDGRQCLQNAERMSLHGIPMFDGTYLPSYNDPRKEA